MNDTDSFANFPPIGFLIATKRVAEDENKVCFLYREEPMDPQDSGWRVFAGDESQAYLDNPDNSGIYNPTTILTIDPSLRELLLKPVGSAFEREDPTAEWKAAEGFEVGGGDEVGWQGIGGAWSLQISGIFDRSEDEEGDHVFAAEGRTVRIAIWDFSDKQPAESSRCTRNSSKTATNPSIQPWNPLICQRLEFQESALWSWNPTKPTNTKSSTATRSLATKSPKAPTISTMTMTANGRSEHGIA
jgi:hypothetical protein